MLVQTGDLTPGNVLHRRQVYNALDCCLTLEIFEELSTLAGAFGPGYAYERAMQGPALEMMLRGFLIDQYERKKAVARLREEIGVLSGQLDRLAMAVWDRPLNPRSPKQLQDFFYGCMRLPEVWTRFKGEAKLSMNRETLERLEVYLHPRPIVAHILAIRERAKLLEVLETEIDPDGRMRTSYNIAGTETWRWSSSENAYRTGCVLPSTEVLTPLGWQRIDTVSPGSEIAQYDPSTKTVSFVSCEMHRDTFEGKMLRVKTEQTQQTLTPDHRVLWEDARRITTKTSPAWEVSRLSKCNIPLGGLYLDGTLNYPPYLPMLMADFTKEPTGWRGAFKKPRKIARFLRLAKAWGIPFTEQKGAEGYRRFYVPGHLDLPKAWDQWVLNLSPHCAGILLEEARYWDAHDRTSGFIFYSSKKSQAEWFATLAHIAGKSATIRREEQNPGSYSTTTMWWVNVKARQHAQLQRKHWGTFEYSGPVYCPQVPSSYWLMRENGFISVTGNTNLQNVTAELRQVFIADPGWKLCGIDLEQAESREVAWLCGTLFGEWSYMDACLSGDLHTTVCQMAWPSVKWTTDPKANRALADEPFYRHLSRRDLAKKLGHGSNYFGAPPTMAKHAKLPVRVTAEFQGSYFGAFPGIPAWHRHVAQSLHQTRSITNVFGFKREFFGRARDDTTLREAIAFGPQSATGIRLNLALWRIWRDMGRRIKIIAQVHDALYFLYREADEKELIEQALSLISIPMRDSKSDRTYTVPGEAKVGWNWGNFGPTNPDGLRKYKGAPDERQRHTGLDRIL